jgi:hypothetical protein
MNMYLRFKNLKFKNLTGCWPQAVGYWQLNWKKVNLISIKKLPKARGHEPEANFAAKLRNFIESTTKNLTFTIFVGLKPTIQ